MRGSATEDGFALRGGERWRDPWPAYRRLRDDAPVHRVDHETYGEFWVLSRFNDVFDAARDAHTFSSAQGLTPDAAEMAMFEGHAAPIVMMDPPDHTAMRRLVSQPMTPRRVAAIEPALRAFVDEKLDDIAELGVVDIVESLFKPLPSLVVAHYLGVPIADRAKFDKWTNAIVAANATGDITGAPDAALDLFGYATDLIERRKVDPADDLISGLVHANPDQVSAEWIIGFVFTMVAGGNDTTTGLLGGAAELLTLYADQRKVLLEDRSLVRSAVSEFLRLTTPVQNLARTTTRTLAIYDTIIPAGRKVMLLYGAGNRDEREFGPDAEQLNVRRNIKRMLSFGFGAHHCLGAAAARLQAEVVLERLLERFPGFVVDPAAGRFAPGPYVRRYEYLPFATTGLHD